MEFPTLNSGAVMQYPARRTLEYSTEVTAFVDGSEQRFRKFNGSKRKWLVRLSQLSEDEMYGIRTFVVAQGGAAQTFAFRDPWDSVQYPNCAISQESIDLLFGENGAGSTSLVIEQINS